MFKKFWPRAQKFSVCWWHQNVLPPKSCLPNIFFFNLTIFDNPCRKWVHPTVFLFNSNKFYLYSTGWYNQLYIKLVYILQFTFFRKSPMCHPTNDLKRGCERWSILVTINNYVCSQMEHCSVNSMPMKVNQRRVPFMVGLPANFHDVDGDSSDHNAGKIFGWFQF